MLTFFNNGFYTFTCLLTFILILAALWRHNTPGVFAFAFGMQWVQVFAFILWMNVRDKPMDFLSPSAPNALIFACVGLLLMALIIQLFINRSPQYSDQEFEAQAKLINPKKILTLYLVSTVFLSSIGFVLGNTSGFAQILVTLSSFKWVFFMVYAYVAWINKKNRLILLLIILYEFTSGLYSFFSSFKEVLFYTLIVSISLIKQIKFRQFLIFLVVGFCLVALFFTWTVIKGSYRQFLNQGKKQQVVNVSQSEAFSMIGEKVSNLTWKNYQMASGAALYRLQYLYHLAIVMDRIPTVVPHENGKVWWDNITFVLTPRLLFPNKPVYEATVKTNKYTGFRYAGMQKGASFSLGYFADSYVDFGYIGMFFPLAMLALFVGLIFRTFMNMHQMNLFFRLAIVNVTILNFASFEADGLFLFGRLLTTFLVFLLLSKTVIPKIQNWLYKS
ncbi:MAG TPA: hypothetical protein VIM79_05160 [Niastella sp.]